MNPRAPRWPGQGTARAGLSCRRGTRGSGLPSHPGLPRLPPLGRERESGGLLQILQPFVGRVPRVSVSAAPDCCFSRLEQSGQDLCPSILTSSDSRPLGWIKLGTTRNPRKRRGWRPRVTLIRSGIELRRARRPSRSPPPRKGDRKKKIAQIAGGLHEDRYPSCKGEICVSSRNKTEAILFPTLNKSEGPVEA